MPISLPPISRRRFLSTSALAGAGLALGPELFAADFATNANSFALLADTHIAADTGISSRGVNMAGHLRSVLEEIERLKSRPAAAFVIGDLAYSKGEPGDYVSFGKLLEGIRKAQVPVHLALGNHDQRENFWSALSGEKSLPRPVVARQVMRVRSPLADWYLLDSLETTLSTPGLLGKEQLSWLAKSLDEETDRPAIVLAHHNLGTKDNVAGLKDTADLLEVIRPRKQVKAFIFGHTHNWSVTRDESGIHLINLPPVAYVFRKDSPSGWLNASVSAQGMRLELRCTDTAHKLHGTVTALQWRA